MAFSTMPRIWWPVALPGVDVQQTVEIEAVGEEQVQRVDALPPVQALNRKGPISTFLQRVRSLPLVDLDLRLFLILEHREERLGPGRRQLAVARMRGTNSSAYGMPQCSPAALVPTV